jgi:hypothetical protein
VSPTIFNTSYLLSFNGPSVSLVKVEVSRHQLEFVSRSSRDYLAGARWSSLLDSLHTYDDILLQFNPIT